MLPELLLIGAYAFVSGLYVGEWRTERRRAPAVRAHDAIRDNALNALQTRAFVGSGPEVTNVSEWNVGVNRFRVTIEPLMADDEKEHGTKP